MCCGTRWVARAAAALLLVATGASTPSRAQEPPPPKCCFTNPRYAGVCEVQPAKDETCRTVLDYLNNPMAQGKSYCGNTQVRGGWKAKGCVPKQK
jgi:hypothetical protein